MTVPSETDNILFSNCPRSSELGGLPARRMLTYSFVFAQIGDWFSYQSFPFRSQNTILERRGNLLQNVAVAKKRLATGFAAFPCVAVKGLNTAIKRILRIAMSVVFTLSVLAQDSLPTFKVNVESALVWDKDSPESAQSFVVWDPLTGNEIHKLSAGGVEVSSVVGYERVSSSQAGKLLTYTTTIANNTDSDLSVRYGGASVDRHTALPLWVAFNKKKFKKRDRPEIWELGKMHCFKSGFASSENVFSAHTISKVFTVRPKTAMTISSVTMDPRSSPVLCSVDGCHIKGTIRYYITVNRKDYVFVWPGHSVIYCGE